ncbi:MAG: TOBE domain-containing protein [Desulfobacterales bacterium]|nr:TOBE domain-containing protein [Desulfobacterales bacterium]
MTPDSHAGMVAATTKKSIDPVELQRLENAFRNWASAPSGIQRKLSRKRVLLIFLLIRHTGARLNEILSLHPLDDIDFSSSKVLFHKGDVQKAGTREVQIPELLADEIKSTLGELQLSNATPELFKIDPAHVRRKFYACAESAGIPRELGTPEAIRRSRAIELMQSNVPLPVVQRIMGHSTPNLAASYVLFSEEEIRKVERLHIERENKRKTSARNSFFGKIDKVRIGDIQAGLDIISIDGQSIHALVTKDSQLRLGLKPGCLVAVEVKAPWVILYKGLEEPACSAENRFKGTVLRIIKGKINSEVVVQISDRTELCAILTEYSCKSLAIKKGDPVWAVFNAAMAVIHVD